MTSDAVRVERLKLKALKLQRQHQLEDRVLDVLTSPNMVRLLAVGTIIAYSTYCARSEHNVGPVASALAFALPGIGIPVIAADAGITDKYALAAISAAGIGYTTGQMTQGWSATNFWKALTPWPD